MSKIIGKYVSAAVFASLIIGCAKTGGGGSRSLESEGVDQQEVLIEDEGNESGAELAPGSEVVEAAGACKGVGDCVEGKYRVTRFQQPFTMYLFASGLYCTFSRFDTGEFLDEPADFEMSEVEFLVLFNTIPKTIAPDFVMFMDGICNGDPGA